MAIINNNRQLWGRLWTRVNKCVLVLCTDNRMAHNEINKK